MPVEGRPSIRLVLDEEQRVYDVAVVETVVQRGEGAFDLRAWLGRPAIEMFSEIDRDDLARAFESAAHAQGTAGAKLRATLELDGVHGDYMVHVSEGTRFTHVGIEPIWAPALVPNNAQSEDERESDPSRRLEYIGMVASRISHDFKNLLAAILVNAEFLRRETADADCVREVAEEILIATERARELIEQILEHAGSRVEPRSLVDINELTREMGRLLEVSTPPTVVLRYHLDEGLPGVDAQTLRLRQLLLNFIVNAAEAIGDEVGAIVISSCVVDASAELLARTRTPSVPAPGAYICLGVEDTGPGLDPETAERIFDPFFSTKSNGHGLGLSGCLATVEEHGGALLLDTAVGQGTSFRVYLPVVKDVGPEAPEAATVNITRMFKGKTVLVIDDDELVRSVTRRTLRARGFEVLMTCDGLQGIESFDEEHSRLDAVLLDMGMPYMTGNDVFDELRRINPHVPIIFVSGQSEAELYQYEAVSQAEGVIFKPFRDGELLSTLARVIDTVSAEI